MQEEGGDPSSKGSHREGGGVSIKSGQEEVLVGSSQSKKSGAIREEGSSRGSNGSCKDIRSIKAATREGL